MTEILLIRRKPNHPPPPPKKKKKKKKHKQKKKKNLLTLSQTSPGFVCSTSLENTVGKGEIASNEQFIHFPQCFLPFWELSAIFIWFKIVVCKIFQIGIV